MEDTQTTAAQLIATPVVSVADTQTQTEIPQQFYGQTLVDLPELTRHLRHTEALPIEVKLLDARVYPDGRVTLVRHRRRSRGSMSVRHFVEKLRRDYPGLDFSLPIHGRCRLDTARLRLNGW